MRGAVVEWTGIMCMIPRPLENQLEQKTWTFIACLGLGLASDLLKGQKTTKKTAQQPNGGGERVGWWENGEGSCT